MEHPGFFERAGPFPLSRVADAGSVEIRSDAAHDIEINDIKPLDLAGANDVSFLDNKHYLPQLDTTSAGACFVAPAVVERVPHGTIALVTPQPYHAFANALSLFYPDANRPVMMGGEGHLSEELIHPTAIIDDGATLEPGVIVGPEARIGAGSHICAGAVIGYRVHIGRNCLIGAVCSIMHSLIGDNVIVHSGCHIGQDGFGFALGGDGHLKVPQIGRVIIQDNVEMGAGNCIDRGAINDTIIGEGTKIDNMVQIGHNAVIGRHCVLVSQTAVGGSTTLGDFVVVGGQAGIIGHLTIGAGVQIAGSSGVNKDIPAGERYGGYPAMPARQWGRQLATLKKLTNKGRG